MLYETDLRLRPDGASGLLVSEFDAFDDYQRTQAWVWEHQALTRARFVAGDRAVGAAFERLRSDVLRLPRDAARCAPEVVAMRSTHARSAPQSDARSSTSSTTRGGIVDVEFVVQFLVLAHAHTHAALTGNIGNLALLQLAGELRLIDADARRAGGTMPIASTVARSTRCDCAGNATRGSIRNPSRSIARAVLALWRAGTRALISRPRPLRRFLPISWYTASSPLPLNTTLRGSPNS